MEAVRADVFTRGEFIAFGFLSPLREVICDVCQLARKRTQLKIKAELASVDLLALVWGNKSSTDA